MSDEHEVLILLGRIHDLLVPISACYQEQYRGIQRQRFEEKLEELESLLTTSKRRRIFSYLFDARGLSQADIAKEAGTTQATVSRFVSVLVEHDFVEQATDQAGTITYVDKHGLHELVEVGDERVN